MCASGIMIDSTIIVPSFWHRGCMFHVKFYFASSDLSLCFAWCHFDPFCQAFWTANSLFSMQSEIKTSANGLSLSVTHWNKAKSPLRDTGTQICSWCVQWCRMTYIVVLVFFTVVVTDHRLGLPSALPLLAFVVASCLLAQLDLNPHWLGWMMHNRKRKSDSRSRHTFTPHWFVCISAVETNFRRRIEFF